MSLQEYLIGIGKKWRFFILAVLLVLVAFCLFLSSVGISPLVVLIIVMFGIGVIIDMYILTRSYE